MVGHILGNLRESIQLHGTGDLICQVLGVNADGVYLPAAHNGRDHALVRNLQHPGKVVQQLAGAAKGKGLVHRPYPLVAHLHSRAQGGLQLGGVVTVIVSKGYAAVGAGELKPPVRAVKVL